MTQKKFLGTTLPITELASNQGRLNPFPFFQQMRKKSPVKWDEERECWDIFNYQEVAAILRNNQVFSSKPITDRYATPLKSIVKMDPPRHTQMRNLVNQSFTPKSIEKLHSRINSIADELLDQVVQVGKMDIMHDFAYPLPVTVIAELLGVPSADRHLFKKWSDIIFKSPDNQSNQSFQKLLAEKRTGNLELQQYFQDIISDRRKRPQMDLITQLIEAQVDGTRLTNEEILEFCVLLLVAGNETTTNLITNFVRRLVEDPSLQVTLTGDPTLIKNAIEEILRFYPPILSISRLATENIIIDNQQIHSGQHIVVWLGSANRDENYFSYADQFMVNRSPNPHLSFGSGSHFCLGAPLARLEAQIAINKLIHRLSPIRLQVNTELVPFQSTNVYGLQELLVDF